MKRINFEEFRSGMSGPNMDTRQWESFGTVLANNECPDGNPVIFDKEYGPLVLVKLHPSGAKVVCRVASTIAGQGEGEWFPFIEHDEVLVALPEGDERAGCTITGRLNNEIDSFPLTVGGQDVTKNNFAFKRVRTPYVFEFGETYLMRSAKYQSFILFDNDGAITASNADGAFMTVGLDVLGFQSSDGECLIQVDTKDKIVRVEAGLSKFHLDSDGESMLLTSGTLMIGTSGNQPVGHALTLENLCAILIPVMATLGGEATLIAALSTASAATLSSALTTAIGGILSASIPTANKPGIAVPGLLIG